MRYFCLDTFPVVLVGEAGFRLPDGTATGGLATGFGTPWTGAAQKTGPPPVVELSVLVPLNRPWRSWLLPSRPLPVSKHQRDRAPATIKGNSELGQLAQSRQHRPQSVGGGGGGGVLVERQCKVLAACSLGA